VDLTVAEAAARLHVDRSRVEQLLRSGRLGGRRSGRTWLVDADALARLSAHARAPGRPMAPARAWGLLDILDGGSGPWLSPVARSQVRARLRDLRSADAEEWRALLRARSHMLLVGLHPAALQRLLSDDDRVLPAGPARAAKAGADLVALAPVAEVYIRPDDWPALAERWHAKVPSADANLRVRLPREVWPFDARGEVGAAVLAVDLLESPEPRAVSAGLQLLRERVRDVV
jgi:excisionase family DNA binding protein